MNFHNDDFAPPLLFTNYAHLYQHLANHTDPDGHDPADEKYHKYFSLVCLGTLIGLFVLICIGIFLREKCCPARKAEDADDVEMNPRGGAHSNGAYQPFTDGYAKPQQPSSSSPYPTYGAEAYQPPQQIN